MVYTAAVHPMCNHVSPKGNQHRGGHSGKPRREGSKNRKKDERKEERERVGTKATRQLANLARSA